MTERPPKERTGKHSTRVTVDLSRIPADQFEPKQPLRVATVRDDKVLDSVVVTPAEQKNPRQFQVTLNLGEPVDGVAGAHLVVAPADDERNLQSPFAVKRFVASSGAVIEAGSLVVSPGIYKWWIFCWRRRTYHVAGRVVRHEGDCIHPIGGARVELYDVDYCWWWFNEDLITSQYTDADGFFDITFTWCVPLWCFLRPRPPIFIDPDLRDRLLIPIKKFPPIPPDDPWEWEEFLRAQRIEIPQSLPATPVSEGAMRQPVLRPMMRAASAGADMAAGSQVEQTLSRADLALQPLRRWQDLWGDLIWWRPCDDPCDFYPDVRIRVTQDQPGAGTVEIFRESFWDIHWNLNSDLLDLSLEASSAALHSDVCHHEPILGNCILFDGVGAILESTIYQPELSAGFSYGTTPDRKQRLGYTVSRDRAFMDTLDVMGRFGIAAPIDYYQVQAVKWTASDLDAWELDHTYVPGGFSAVSPSRLESFTRYFREETTIGPITTYPWKAENFGPLTVGGVTGVYKSKRRFMTEYEAAHGGPPAPPFGGWDWWFLTEDEVFRLNSQSFQDGVYTFRLVGYTQTGVDGGGNPILTPVNQGLPGGVLRQCSNLVKPALLTIRIANTGYFDPVTLTSVLHQPWVRILNFTKNGVTPIDECEIIVLDTTDSVSMEFEVTDATGNLDSWGVTLQRGSDSPVGVVGGAGVTTVPSPVLSDYALAPDPAKPSWTGGTTTINVPASFLVAMGGSCAYNLRVSGWNRQTDGWGSGDVYNEHNRAFTVILASDKAHYCAQLGCDDA
ncbi:MAG: hypothetical protein U0452_14560 [Anaerolineae bacterium]